MIKKIMSFILIISILLQHTGFLVFADNYVSPQEESVYYESIDSDDSDTQGVEPGNSDDTSQDTEESGGEGNQPQESSQEAGEETGNVLDEETGEETDEETDEESDEESGEESDEEDVDGLDEEAGDGLDEETGDDSGEKSEDDEAAKTEKNLEAQINVLPYQQEIQNSINLSFSFSHSGSTINLEDKNTYILRKNSWISLNVELQPTWQTGYASGVKVYINLPTCQEVSDAGIGVTDIIGMDNWTIESKPDSNGIYKEQLVLSYNNRFFTGSVLGITPSLKFYGDAPENWTATVTGYVEYTQFNNESLPWRTPGEYDPNAEVRVVNTNLEWKTDFIEDMLSDKTTVFWDTFNIVSLILEIKNTSESELCVINDYLVNLTLPTNVSGHFGSLYDHFITMWLYEDGSEPKENTSGQIENKLFTGVPGKGGVLVYDVTDMNKTELESFVSSERTGAKPLPYYCIGSGLLSIKVDGEAGKIYGKNDTLGSSKRLLIEVSMPNLQENKELKELPFSAQPTIYFGTEGSKVAWSQTTSTVVNIDMPKEELPEINKAPQAGEAYYGEIGSYYIQNIKNNSNVPIFGSYVIDELPEGFSLEKLAYEFNGTEDFDCLPVENREIKPDTFTYEVKLPKTDEETGDETGDEDETQWRELFETPLNASDGNFVFSVGKKFLDDVDAGLFTGRIKIVYKERIEPDEVIPGKLVISGRLSETKTMLNKAHLYYTYKYDKSSEITYPFESKYEESDGKPVEAEASLAVVVPVPLLESEGKNYTTKEIKKNVIAYYNKDNAYRYYLGNGSGAAIKKGIFEVKIPVSQPQTYLIDDPTGFILHEITLSKDLLANGTVERIEIKDILGDTIEEIINPTESPENNIVITINDGRVPSIVTVYFEKYEGNKTIDKNAYIELKGIVNQYGDLTSNGTWYCVFEDNSDSSETLDVKKPDLGLTSTGYDGVTQSGKSSVFYGVENGFRYYPKNNVGGAIYNGIFEAELPVEINEGNAVGILLDKIYISDDLMVNSVITQIDIEHKDLDGNTSIVVLNYAGNPLKETEVKLTRDNWKDKAEAKGVPTKVKLYFEVFQDPDVENGKDAYIQLTGLTNDYNKLLSRSTWECELPSGETKSITSSYELTVTKPDPKIHARALDEEDKDDTSFTDTREVMWGEDHRYRFYPANNNSAVMLSSVLTVDLYNKEEPSGKIAGFLLNEIVIGEQMLKNGDLIKLDIYYGEENKIATFNKEMLAAFTSESGSIKIENGVINDKINENGYAKKVVLYFDNFKGNVLHWGESNTENYLELKGNVNLYASLKADAKWACVFFDNTTVYNESKAVLDVILPNPNVSAFTEYYQYKDKTGTYEITKDVGSIKVSELSDKSLRYGKIPHSRKGSYNFVLSNDSVVPVEKSVGTIEINDNYFKWESITLSKEFVEAAEIDEIELFDAYYDDTTATDKTKVIEFDNALIDVNGAIVLERGNYTNIDSLKRVVIHMNKFKEPDPADDSVEVDAIKITLSGYFNTPPITKAVSEPNSTAVMEWNIAINEDGTITTKDAVGFAVMAASIDIDFFAKTGVKEGGGHEYSTTPYLEYGANGNQYLDIGYKAIGSFTVDIIQEKAYERNVPMDLSLEVKLPHEDFELYYVKIANEMKEYLKNVEIYRLDSSDTERKWAVIDKSKWQNNASDSLSFRINTLLPSNNIKDNTLFSSYVGGAYTDNTVHPYYRSPLLSTQLKKQVTRVVFNFSANMDEGTSEAGLPDINGKDLLELTGRFLKHSGTGYAEAKMTYKFVDGTPVTPDDTLLNDTSSTDGGKVMTNNEYLNNDKYNTNNYRGTGYTRAYFVMSTPNIELRKGVRDLKISDDSKQVVPAVRTGTEASASTYALVDEPVFGTLTGFNIGYWNTVGIGKSVSPNNVYDWKDKMVYADSIVLVDKLPALTPVEVNENTFYEGFLPKTIKWNNANIDDLESITLTFLKGEKKVFDKDDFTVGNVVIGLNYPNYCDSDGIKIDNDLYDDSSGIPFVDVTGGDYLTGIEVEIKNIIGDGDLSGEFTGLTPSVDEDLKLSALVLIEGYICSVKYQANELKGKTILSMNNKETETDVNNSDFAKIKAESQKLAGELTITHNITGKNKYVYNPQDTDTPNTMEYYYDISNPDRENPNDKKANIKKFDVTIPGITGFRLEDIIIPAELFNGSLWKCEKVEIYDPLTKNNINILGEFKKADGDSYYRLHVRNLFVTSVYGLLQTPDTQDDGYVSYLTGNIYITFTAIGDGLKEGYNLSDLHDITLSGVYAETKAGISDGEWDKNSRATIATSQWDYKQEFNKLNSNMKVTLVSHSLSRFTSPQNEAESTATYGDHTIYNLYASIDSTIELSDFYDKHKGNVIKVENKDPLTGVMPGDRLDVELTLTLGGATDDYEDSFTYLQNPVLRYTIPKLPKLNKDWARIVSWKYIKSPESGITTVCKDVTTNSQTIIHNDTELPVSGSYVRDLAWALSGKLDEGQTISISLTLEITDDVATDSFNPNYQDIKEAVSAGSFTVSGDEVHGYRGVAASGKAGLEQIKEAVLNPWVDALKDIPAIKNTSPTKDLYYMSTKPVKLTASSAIKDYLDKETFVGELPYTITVSDIENYTKHDETGLILEVVLHENADDERYARLTEWPKPKNPEGKVLGELYYKIKPKAGGNLSDWLPVNKFLSAPSEIDTIQKDYIIYALKWNYGELPAYTVSSEQKEDGTTITVNNPVKLDDVTIEIVPYDYTPEDSSTYTLNSVVNSYFYHNEHGYSDEFKDGSLMSIGRRSTLSTVINKSKPFVEIKTEILTESGNEEKTTYRPGDEFLYKNTIWNSQLNATYNKVGTGPLLNPVVFDKVPEYVIMPKDLKHDSYNLTEALNAGDIDIKWYDGTGNPVPVERLSTLSLTVTEIEDYDYGGMMSIPYTTDTTIGASVIKDQSKVDKIKFYVYKFDFGEQRLEIGERIEIQYKAKVREDYLPSITFMKDGESKAAYLPRMGEYRSNPIYPQANKTAPWESGVESSSMDGDYLLHDVGVSGKPNPGTASQYFLQNSLTTIPGYAGFDLPPSSGVSAEGHNNNLFDFDLKNGLTQEAEFRLKGSNGVYTQHYVNRLSQSSGKTDNDRDIWTLIMKPRSEQLNNLNGGENIVWAQSRMSLSKAWLYAASEMFAHNPDGAYKDNMNISTPTYTNDEYTYGVEIGEVYNARLIAVNYGGHKLDGVEFIYVLPSGTEPVIDESDNIDIKAYYGIPGNERNGQTVPTTEITGDNIVSFEIIQKPDSSEVKYHSPKTLMDARVAPDSPADCYYENNASWVIKVTVNSPLYPWWNHATINGGSRDTKDYFMYAELKCRIKAENVDGSYYDEVYAYPIETENSGNSNYFQYYSIDYAVGGTLDNSFKDAAYNGMNTTSPSTVTFYSPQTPYIRGRNYQGKVVSDVQSNNILTINAIRNGDTMKTKKPFIRLWADIGEADTEDFFTQVKDEPFDLNIYVQNKYAWADKVPNNTTNNHRTDGGLKGTYFEPVITNILPYGIVPVDTEGKAFPLNKSEFETEGNSRTVDYKASVEQNSDAQWDVIVEYVETGEGDEGGRYKLTWVPNKNAKDVTKIKYDETLNITLKAVAVDWPYNPNNEELLNDSWQKNRIYASSQRDVFAFEIEPSNSPYVVGATGTGLPDAQGLGDNNKIKAFVLGTMKKAAEEDELNIQDYVDKDEIKLLDRDFNKNGESGLSINGEVVFKDQFVSNELTIFTKRPRIVVDKKIGRLEDTGFKEEQSELFISYLEDFWYSVKMTNEAPELAENANMEERIKHFALTGTLWDYQLVVNEWLPAYASIKGGYKTGNVNDKIEFVDDEVEKDGFKFFSFEVTPAHATDSTKESELKSGDSITLYIPAMITSVPDSEPASGLNYWGDFINTVYVNAEPLTQKDKLPDNFIKYVPEVKENGSDYNLNDQTSDTFAFAEDNGFRIYKPKGHILHDTVKKKVETGTGENIIYDYPAYTNAEEVEFMISEIGNYSANVQRLVIMAHELTEVPYEVDTTSNTVKTTPSYVKTGVWEVPAGFDINDYEINVYYTTEKEDFYKFVYDGDWTLLDKATLTENKEIKINDVEDEIQRIIFEVKSKSDKLVPAGIKIRDDADENKAGIQTMLKKDSDENNSEEPPDPANKYMPKVAYSSRVSNNMTKLLYSCVSLWVEYVNEFEIVSKSFAGANLTTSYPVVDIRVDTKYFKFYNDSINETTYFKWDNTLAINILSSKTLKYTITYESVNDNKLISVGSIYTEDAAVNPEVVVDLSSMLNINSDSFKKEQTNARMRSLSIFDENYTSNSDILSVDHEDELQEIPKWTWRLVGVDGIQPPESKVEFDSVTITPGKGGRNVITWKFKDALEPGESIEIKFIASVDNYERKIEQDNVYGYNVSGMIIAYDADNANRVNQTSLNLDLADTNNNAIFNERFVATSFPDFSFAISNEYKIYKKSFSDVSNSGLRHSNAPTDAIAVYEGSTFTFETTVTYRYDADRKINNPIIYDIMPYYGDLAIVDTHYTGTDTYLPQNRNSQWHGWLIPSSIIVTEYDDNSTPATLDTSDYTVWVGDKAKDELGDLITRSSKDFYSDITKDNVLKNQLGLSDLKTVAGNESIVKNIRQMFIQMNNDYLLKGGYSLTVSYQMQAPLNTPFYDQSKNNIEDNLAWNSFASNHSGSSASLTGSNLAGAYITTPIDTDYAYIGDYVWIDLNGNGIQDESDNQIASNGRMLPSKFNSFGDVGIDGVKVELLTEDYFPSDSDGNRIGTELNGGVLKYYVLNADGTKATKTVGNSVVDIMGGKPLSYTTTKDVEGRSGFYILSNIKTGNKYRLKFTFPSEYEDWGITSTQIHENVGVVGYGPDMELPDSSGKTQDLCVYSEPFTLERGKSDNYYVDFDLGIGIPISFKGFAFADTDANGKYDIANSELLLDNITVKLYDSNNKPVIDMLNREVKEVTTDNNGEFVFKYLPQGKEYYVVSDPTKNSRVLPRPTKYLGQESNPIANHQFQSPNPSGKNTIIRTKIFETKTLQETDYNPPATVPHETKTMALGFLEPTNNVISGKVWYDANRDGFIDEGEPGIDGVEIRLKRWERASNNSNDSWKENSNAEQITGASGEYSFGQLESGDTQNNIVYGYTLEYITPLEAGYTLTARHADKPNVLDIDEQWYYLYDSDLDENGYLAELSDIIVFAEWNDMQGYSRATTPAVKSGYNAGLAQFDKGAISGTVWDDIDKNGKKDADEDLLKDIEMFLEYRTDENSPYNPVKLKNGEVVLFGDAGYDDTDAIDYSVKTDGIGLYRFENLPIAAANMSPYEYRVYYTKPYYVSYTITGQDSDNVFIGEPLPNDIKGVTGKYILADKYASAITPPTTPWAGEYDLFNSADVDDAHMGLCYPQRAVIKGIVWDDINKDDVFDQSELARPNVHVYLFAKEKDSQGNDNWVGIANGTTDINGEYEFTVDPVNFSYDSLSPLYLMPTEFRVAFQKTMTQYITSGKVKDGTKEPTITIGVLDPKEWGITDVITFGNLDVVSGRFDFAAWELANPTIESNCGIVDKLSAEIEGFVWIDEDNSGTYNIGEKMAEGIEVSLYRFDSINNTWVNIPDLMNNSQVKTDQNGKYRFEIITADYDRTSSKYLQPYHYFTAFFLPEDYTFTSPMRVTDNKIASSGYDWNNLSESRKNELENTDLKDKKEKVAISPEVIVDNSTQIVVVRSTSVSVKDINCGIVPPPIIKPIVGGGGGGGRGGGGVGFQNPVPIIPGEPRYMFGGWPISFMPNNNEALTEPKNMENQLLQESPEEAIEPKDRKDIIPIEKSPKTGDTIIAYLLLFMLSLIGLSYLLKNRSAITKKEPPK